MRSDRAELVGNAFLDVIEKLAFMFGEPVYKDEAAEAPFNAVQARMSFRGAMSGSLLLAVPSQLCPEMAANVLGTEPDEEIALERATDTLKEVLNVTCGNVLTALAGEEPVFELSIPEVSELDVAKWGTLLDDPNTLSFLVDARPVLLNLELEGNDV